MYSHQVESIPRLYVHAESLIDTRNENQPNEPFPFLVKCSATRNEQGSANAGLLAITLVILND